jgi:serine protease
MSQLRMSHVLVLLLAVLAVMVFVPGATSTSSTSAVDRLPDLDQELPSDLRVTLAGTPSAPSYRLGFRSAVGNIGDGPLVIRGHRDDVQTPVMTADQVIDRSDGSQAVVPNLGMLRYVVSPDHQHWHYLGFDRYQIYELHPARTPASLERDHKTGFCLGDRYRTTRQRASNAPPNPVYVGRCGLGDPSLLTVEEGITVGYGDSYGAFLEGQDMPLDGLPDGRYVLVNRVNADRKIREISYANDAASILLDLRWAGSVPHLRVVASCPDSGECESSPAAHSASSRARCRESNGRVARRCKRRAASQPSARPAGSFLPDDSADGTAGGWAALQWNFAGRYGIDAPRAWANLIADGAPGGAGVTVAVLDTGVASTGSAPYHTYPELAASRIVPGWDFVGNDSDPVDENGHGTYVASVIGEETNNAYGLTGLAYGARIMPVRVLDSLGNGDAATIARGVVYAVDHGAKVINLSLNFSPRIDASQIPQLLKAFAYAARRGSLVVVAAGNEAGATIDFPARSPNVLAVGATTEFGCVANYSNYGAGLDVVAPGGGVDASLTGDRNCRTGRTGRPIYQFGLKGSSNPYAGTSMAAPHVSATAALVIASGVLGVNPSPAQIAARIERTARDLGPVGHDPHYGWGLVDAGAATASSKRRDTPPTR